MELRRIKGGILMVVFKVMPRYADNMGDVTDVYFIDSKGKVSITTLNQKSSGLIKKMVKTNGLSPSEINKIAKEITGLTRNNPIYLSPSEIFIQIKVRKPRVTGDPGYGYVNLDYIRNLGPSELSMINQSVQSTMESMTVISKRIEAAGALRALMLEKLGFNTIKLDQENNALIINGRSISIESLMRCVKIQGLLSESKTEGMFDSQIPWK